jgi:hypothetical protein
MFDMLNESDSSSREHSEDRFESRPRMAAASGPSRSMILVSIRFVSDEIFYASSSCMDRRSFRRSYGLKIDP